MPVIPLSLIRLKNYAHFKADEKQILEALPYLGLDIENQEGDTISVEYSPNRPDFSSEAGIARSLLGLLDLRTGLPTYSLGQSEFKIRVAKDEIREARPHIFGLYADIEVTEEIIKQLIAMQEDLHNGLGRKRSKVAIGIHNAAVIKGPISYRATRDKKFAFVPLGDSSKRTIEEVLTTTEQGIVYGKLVSSGIYPILEDVNGNLLSMPPIINGELTRLKTGINKLFVDVTATDERAGDATIAIIAAMLSDIGAKVQTVDVEYDSRLVRTPDMTPREMNFDLALVNRLLGLRLSIGGAAQALAKSRLQLDQRTNHVRIPRYRSDIIHPVDLAEETVLGYGVARMEPTSVESSLAGSFNPTLKKLDKIIDVLVGLGLTEIWNLSLIDKGKAERCPDYELLKVDDPKSLNFEYLRCNLSSSLLGVLGASTHKEYPQKIFEQAPVFEVSPVEISSVREKEHVAVMLADSSSNFSTIRSVLDGFARLAVGAEKRLILMPIEQDGDIFAGGRSATISVDNDASKRVQLGIIGEVSPRTLEKYGLKVPVCGFELNLDQLLKE